MHARVHKSHQRQRDHVERREVDRDVDGRLV